MAEAPNQVQSTPQATVLELEDRTSRPAQGAAAAPAAGRLEPGSLIDQILSSGNAVGEGRTGSAWIAELQDEASLEKALVIYIRHRFVGGRAGQAANVRNALAMDIRAIDKLLAAQVNSVLHHEEFQRLEALWRGVHYTLQQGGEDEAVKVKLLNASWRDLSRDVANASMPDETHLFNLVYEQGIGMPGEDPFSCLVGDYYIRHRPGAGHPEDDLATLRSISAVAGSAFCPFIAGADPALLSLPNMTALERPFTLTEDFKQTEYIKWRSFRETEDARFIGLALPRVLMRLPYRDDQGTPHGFRFHEAVEGPDASKYLWGNAAFAFAGVLINSFVRTRWLVDIRGFRRSDKSGGSVDGQGGVVTGLPRESFRTDSPGLAAKAPVEVMISELQERELSEAGFIPLCHSRSSDLCVFYANQSVQKPVVYSKAIATANSRLSAMLQYILCVSRVAHYVKIMGRDLCGSYSTAEQIQPLLGDWISQYVANDASASNLVKGTHPLRDASVKVFPSPGGRPGSYHCEMHLLPHSQMDMMSVGIRLTTQLSN